MLKITETPHRGPSFTWTADNMADLCAKVIAARPRSGFDPEASDEDVVAWLRSDLRDLDIVEVRTITGDEVRAAHAKAGVSLDQDPNAIARHLSVLLSEGHLAPGSSGEPTAEAWIDWSVRATQEWHETEERRRQEPGDC